MRIANAPEVGDPEMQALQQARLLALGMRTMTLPLGRGALTLGQPPPPLLYVCVCVYVYVVCGTYIHTCVCIRDNSAVTCLCAAMQPSFVANDNQCGLHALQKHAEAVRVFAGSTKPFLAS